MPVLPTFKGEAGAHAILFGVASNKKPRIFQDGRDIAINSVLIIVLMVVAVGAVMVLMMIWRPEGLLPVKRPHVELTR